MAKKIKRAERIRVLVKEPGTLQEIVGGHIEVVWIPGVRDCVIIVNEEGKLSGLDLNFPFFGDWIVGTAVFCGVDGQECSDVPGTAEDLELLLPVLREAREPHSQSAAPTAPSEREPRRKREGAAEDMYEQVAALYREMCPMLPGVRDLTDARRSAMRARMEHAPEGQIWAMWRELFGHVRRSSFLRGENSRGWRATLDWLINPTNFDKVMAGTYDDRGTASNPAGSFDTDEFFAAACARR